MRCISSGRDKGKEKQILEMEDRDIAMGEADVELAEQVAFEQRQAGRLSTMTRESMEDVRARIAELSSEELCEFVSWLDEVTRLDEPCVTFAGLVQDCCALEIKRRFMKAHGVEKEGAK